MLPLLSLLLLPAFVRCVEETSASLSGSGECLGGSNTDTAATEVSQPDDTGLIQHQIRRAASTASTHSYKQCSCSSDYPFCWPADGYCYKSAFSVSYSDEICAGSCTGDHGVSATACTCPDDYPYCWDIDGYCYRSSTSMFYSETCPGTCSSSGSSGGDSSGPCSGGVLACAVDLVKQFVPAFGMKEISFEHGGQSRHARAYVPPELSKSPVPLVMSFHAWAAGRTLQQMLDELDTIAATEKFIVVYPQGLSWARAAAIPIPLPMGYTFNGGGCCPDASYDQTDDVGFAKALVQYIDENVHSVDKKRVYATGMSNGGFMSHRLGCEASDVFAAIAPVAGVLSNSFFEETESGFIVGKLWSIEEYPCSPKRPVPVLHIHGEEDMYVPVVGGPPPMFAALRFTIATWKKVNGAEGAPTSRWSNGATSCLSYGKDENNVTECMVADMGHSWPGNPWMDAGTGMHASTEIWRFFKRHSMA